jgi:uncharacterized protein YhbP (UPF0306 family)
MTRLAEAARAEISAFLKKHTTLVIASVDREAMPQAASLFYASDDALNLTLPARKPPCRILSGCPRLVTFIETWDWRDIHGVQMRCGAHLSDPDETDRAWALFRDKFPFTSEFTDQIARSAFYILAPKWIRLVDNSKYFGHREEFTLP